MSIEVKIPAVGESITSGVLSGWHKQNGDLVKDGVCGLYITDKLGISQPTASEHLRVLVAAGFLTGKKIKQWTFYRRDERAIAAFKAKFKTVI